MSANDISRLILHPTISQAMNQPSRLAGRLILFFHRYSFPIRALRDSRQRVTVNPDSLRERRFPWPEDNHKAAAAAKRGPVENPREKSAAILPLRKVSAGRAISACPKVTRSIAPIPPAIPAPAIAAPPNPTPVKARDASPVS